MAETPFTDPAPDSSTAEREAVWRFHRLEEPTFTDLTHGVFFGVLWLTVMWAPMFVSVLLHH